MEFLSTPSARRATVRIGKVTDVNKISIHALREEGDTAPRCTEQRVIKISIHALREEGDPEKKHRSAAPLLFLSTPSARRATTNGMVADVGVGISIHALREEGDFQFRIVDNVGTGYFYPRPPRGGRHVGGDG